MSVQVFCSIFNWVVWFWVLSCINCLCILDNNSFGHMICKYFLYSVGFFLFSFFHFIDSFFCCAKYFKLN